MSQSNKLALILLFALTGIILFILGVSLAAAQGPDDLPTPTLPETLYEYANIPLPAHFTTNQLNNADNTPNNNPITNQGATLGRVLFYDKRLSVNDTVACASCHLQANSFADPRQFSTGFEGGLTSRNAMSLANARFYNNGHFFWDERAASLEDQTLMPIENSVEMGMNLDDLVVKLGAEPYYPPLFEAAFGTPDVTQDRISLALAQFVRSMVAYQSKYDVGLSTDFSNFTAQENRGRQIFNGRGRCNTCHVTDAFIAPEARNNGLDLVYTDNGLGDITGNPADDGKFKVPSLRDVALTAPYMHDGRFDTLADVVEFYNSQVQPHPNLDPRLRQPNGQPRRLNLSQADKEALVAFLETLTDQRFTTDTKFSDPFVSFTDVVYLPLVVK